MQVTSFLTPKAESAYLLETYTLRQAIEKLSHYHYTAVPVLDSEGYYRYTLSLTDCLSVFKELPDMRFVDSEKIPLRSVKIHRQVKPVNISAKFDELLRLATEQNFIPVVDDYGTYIGLVRRKALIEHFLPLLLESSADTE